jgi:hypothetical protein
LAQRVLAVIEVARNPWLTLDDEGEVANGVALPADVHKRETTGIASDDERGSIVEIRDDIRTMSNLVRCGA